eukprot:6020684-Prymnesium_polylepis.1
MLPRGACPSHEGERNASGGGCGARSGARPGLLSRRKGGRVTHTRNPRACVADGRCCGRWPMLSPKA